MVIPTKSPVQNYVTLLPTSQRTAETEVASLDNWCKCTIFKDKAYKGYKSGRMISKSPLEGNEKRTPI